jgi:hypothetical protein
MIYTVHQRLYLLAVLLCCIALPSHGFIISQRSQRLPTLVAAQSTIDSDVSSAVTRRKVLESILCGCTILSSRPVLADDIAAATAAPASTVYTRQTNDFSYTFVPPPGTTVGKKPLPTHLDEINFNGSRSGYLYGITVDPVRIQRLADFGSPEEVAAKVVLAELRRDGVLDVTLVEDPLSKDDYYQLNYLSSGKRGKKRFVTKFYIRKQKLYALTAQCKEEDYSALEQEILQAVDSFQVTIE